MREMVEASKKQFVKQKNFKLRREKEEGEESTVRHHSHLVEVH